MLGDGEMSTKSFPVVVFIVFLIVATPNSAFGFAYYLDSGSYHVIDDDSHKLDDIFLDHNGFRDPGTKLEILSLPCLYKKRSDRGCSKTLNRS